MEKNRTINHKLEQLEPQLLLSADGMVDVLAAPSPVSFGFDSAIEQDLICIELTGENDWLYSLEQTEASSDIFQFNDEDLIPEEEPLPMYEQEYVQQGEIVPEAENRESARNEEGVRVERYQIESGFNSRPLRRRNNVNPCRGSNSRWKYLNKINWETPRAKREGSWETLPQLCCFFIKRDFTRLIKLRPTGGVVYSEDVVTSYYAYNTQTHTDRLVETLHAANGPPGRKGVTGEFVYHASPGTNKFTLRLNPADNANAYQVKKENSYQSLRLNPADNANAYQVKKENAYQSFF
jgi:hypothetical protein